MRLREPLDGKARETREVSILGHESPNARLAAEGHDLGVEDEVPGSLRLTDGLEQQLGEGSSWIQHGETRRRQNPRHRGTGFLGRIGGMKELRMGDDAKELTEDEDRQRPPAASFRESDQTPSRRRMLRQLLAVGIDQDVRVDGDQDRSSMCS
jgi:hypothetical protein